MMDTSSILRYFAYFNPKSIVVVDASSANIEFDNYKTAHRALYTNMRHPPPTKVVENFDEFDPFVPETALSDMLWYEMIPHIIFRIERKLFARFATNRDVKSIEAQNDEMYIKFIKIKSYLKMGGIIQESPKRTEKNRYPKKSKREQSQSRSISRDHSDYSQVIEEDQEYLEVLNQLKHRKKVKLDSEKDNYKWM